ncbi:hypothetical protein C5167_019700 [Papaver somniferum]|uniref:Uncharacterized protein n=1 Tax=Papaver somniferum TaxID=3469 RepID=A0A4Y7IU94_PAPSO|nr:hypothetical protein C5167_019700 [Papaver somniferum]
MHSNITSLCSTGCQFHGTDKLLIRNGMDWCRPIGLFGGYHEQDMAVTYFENYGDFWQPFCTGCDARDTILKEVHFPILARFPSFFKKRSWKAREEDFLMHNNSTSLCSAGVCRIA